MKPTKINDLQAFVIVAREQSFTKAAARLGVSASAISHAMRLLEERLGVRLLARTTRNVAPTEAGERLMRAIAPLFDQIAAEVDALGELRDKPRGTIRITCTDDQIELCVRPMLAGFLSEYPDITLEFYVDYGFTNVVEERFDAGIRLGEAVSKDMIAVPIGPDWRLAVVGAPSYFARHPAPATPGAGWGSTGGSPGRPGTIAPAPASSARRAGRARPAARARRPSRWRRARR